MRPYVSRIPVEDSYLMALGQVIYNFARVEWMLVAIGGLTDTGFVRRESGAAFGTAISEFGLLAEVSNLPELVSFAQRAKDANSQREDLMRAVGISAANNVQELDGPLNGPWEETEVWTFAENLQTFSIESTDYYYSIKNTPSGAKSSS